MLLLTTNQQNLQITKYFFMNRLSNLNQSFNFNHVYDYVVVGGGIAGLQAALILTKSTSNILIIQAQNRLGGKIQSLSLTDLPKSKTVDWILKDLDRFSKVKLQKGATFIEQRHTLLIQFCKKNKIPLKELLNDQGQGNSIYLADKPSTEKQILQNINFGPEILKFLNQIDKLAEQYKKNVLDALKITQNYKKMLIKYDSMTVKQYLELNVTNPKVRQLLESFLQHTECLSVDLNSMHQVLVKHARSNDVAILKEFLGVRNHQTTYLIEGTELVIKKFIENIEWNLKQSIHSITQFQGEVTEIDTINKNKPVSITYIQHRTHLRKVYANTVISAAPLQLLRNICFTNISENKRIVFDNQLRTVTQKTFMIFRSPFWRQKNKTGECLFSSDWMVNMCHDISPKNKQYGIIVFFHAGKKYYQWKTAFSASNEKQNYQNKLTYMKKLVAKIFDIQQGSKQYEDNLKGSFLGQSTFVDNQFIRSGFQSNTRPGTFSRIIQREGDLSALYRDEQNILFVGSQFSDQFASYMEGALRVTRKKVTNHLREKEQQNKIK